MINRHVTWNASGRSPSTRWTYGQLSRARFSGAGQPFFLWTLIHLESDLGDSILISEMLNDYQFYLNIYPCHFVTLVFVDYESTFCQRTAVGVRKVWHFFGHYTADSHPDLVKKHSCITMEGIHISCLLGCLTNV